MIKSLGKGAFINLTPRAPQRMQGVYELSFRIVNTDEHKAIVFQFCNLALSFGYMKRASV